MTHYSRVKDEEYSENEFSISSTPSRGGRLKYIFQQLAKLLVLESLLVLAYFWGRRQAAQTRNIFVPPIPLTRDPVVFERDSLWIGHSPEVDKRWYDDYLIGTEHSIRIDNPEKYGLLPGTSVNGDGQWFSLSMYHQLHCLAMIRNGLYDISNHSHDSPNHENHPRSTSEGHVVLGGHLKHCLDYLRQAILCSGDVTVEWAQVGPNGERIQIDGWGIPHRECKDVSVIDDFISKHRVPS